MMLSMMITMSGKYNTYYVMVGEWHGWRIKREKTMWGEFDIRWLRFRVVKY